MQDTDIVTLLKKVHILVVDDSDSMVSLISTCLRDSGAENVSIAHNGLNAWKMLNKQPFELLVCDWDMPEMTGLELLKLVRESDMHKHIPFLLLTASTEKEKVIQAMKAGVSDYLTKPFQVKELNERVIKLLRKKSADKN